MRQTRLLTILIVAATVLELSGGPAVTAPPSQETAAAMPNIILVLADDMGYGDTGFNGNTIIKTPSLDAMARAGIRFTRFYASAPVCSPTRATCLTGRHYFRYGIFSASIGYLPAEEITVATACKSIGYATGHFGKWHLGPISTNGPTLPEYNHNRLRKSAPPWQRGYDETFVTDCNVPTWNPTQNDAYPPVFRLPFWHNGEIELDNLEGPTAKVVMDRAIPFIGKAVAGRTPFFATIWFHEPHDPVVAGPEYRALYRGCSEPEQHYYGCITAMDEQIGRLCRELRALGAADNTMIWFCSDNGPEGKTGTEKNFRGSTGGLQGRKRSLFEGGIRVPALLVWPGHARPGRVVDVPCCTLDYFPTVAQVIGFKMPDPRPIDGMDLGPILAGDMTRRTKPIPFWFQHASKAAMHGSPTLALVDDHFKLLTNLSSNANEDMLFDVARDPAEKTNLLASHPKLAAAMKTWIRDWTESCKASHSGADYHTPFRPVDEFPRITGAWTR